MDCINDAIDGLKELARKEAKNISFNPTLPCTVYADGQRVTQVMFNLIANALKFSPPESTVMVEIEPTENCFVTVKVIDTGRGVPEEALSRIFDKFEQTQESDAREGSGLGLAICKQIVEQHGGKIGAENHAHGAIFWFSLPTAENVSKRQHDSLVSITEA